MCPKIGFFLTPKYTRGGEINYRDPKSIAFVSLFFKAFPHLLHPAPWLPLAAVCKFPENKGPSK